VKILILGLLNDDVFFVRLWKYSGRTSTSLQAFVTSYFCVIRGSVKSRLSSVFWDVVLCKLVDIRTPKFLRKFASSVRVYLIDDMDSTFQKTSNFYIFVVFFFSLSYYSFVTKLCNLYVVKLC